jgi:hypothetical protein
LQFDFWQTGNMSNTMQPNQCGAWIEGIGLLGPGFNSWPHAANVLRGSEPYQAARTQLPVATLLPAAERRRAVPTVKLTLAAGTEAVAQSTRSAANLATVFSSSSGDGQNIHAICETLALSEREISPTRFHNSVHNAPAGYWGIATGATAASTALCAYDGSFAGGLLEALAWVTCEQTPILLLAYDIDYPEPLRALRPIPDAFCVALVLAPTRSAQSLARIDARIAHREATQLSQPEFENMRRAIPAARALPLIDALAAQRSGTVVLDYLDDCALAVDVQI